MSCLTEFNRALSTISATCSATWSEARMGRPSTEDAFSWNGVIGYTINGACSGSVTLNRYSLAYGHVHGLPTSSFTALANCCPSPGCPPLVYGGNFIGGTFTGSATTDIAESFWFDGREYQPESTSKQTFSGLIEVSISADTDDTTGKCTGNYKMSLNVLDVSFSGAAIGSATVRGIPPGSLLGRHTLSRTQDYNDGQDPPDVGSGTFSGTITLG